MSIIYDFNYDLRIRDHVVAEIECQVEIEIAEADGEISFGDVEARDLNVKLGTRGAYFSLIGLPLHAEIRHELLTSPAHRDAVESLALREDGRAWLPGFRYARVA